MKQNEIQKSQNNNNLPICNNIRNWASDKGIYKNGDLKTQALKLVEEVGELAKAILSNNESEIIDAIGDCGVVLVNVAELTEIHFTKSGIRCSMCTCKAGKTCMEITFENCLGSAYDVIKSRTGKMKNGTFVKNELLLPEKINSKADVYRFLLLLNDNNKLFHPEDSAFDILDENSNRLFDNGTAKKIDSLIEECYTILDDADEIDICEIVLNISNNNVIKNKINS